MLQKKRISVEVCNSCDVRNVGQADWRTGDARVMIVTGDAIVMFVAGYARVMIVTGDGE